MHSSGVARVPGWGGGRHIDIFKQKVSDQKRLSLSSWILAYRLSCYPVPIMLATSPNFLTVLRRSCTTGPKQNGGLTPQPPAPPWLRLRCILVLCSPRSVAGDISIQRVIVASIYVAPRCLLFNNLSPGRNSQ